MPWKITPSLYNSWLFYRYPLFDRDDEQEKAAHDEMLRALRKEKTPDTPEQARGHLFENWVEMLATGKKYELDELEPDELACARAIATNCRDGVFQEKDGRELPSGNYIYGVADCILPTTIVDFKRVGAGKYEQGKYQKSIQHLAYMYIWESQRFDYLICDGESEEPFDEFYTWNSASLGVLESRIALMIHDINCDAEFAPILAENWSYQPKGEKKCETPAENVLTKSLRMDKEFAEDECVRLQAELERTRKALKIAVDALKEIKDGKIPVSLGISMDINDALEQITALEQKDVK